MEIGPLTPYSISLSLYDAFPLLLSPMFFTLFKYHLPTKPSTAVSESPLSFVYVSFKSALQDFVGGLVFLQAS